MSEKNGPYALDYILETIKEERDNSANLANILGFRDRAFKGKYKEVDENAIEEAWLNLFLDGWIGPKAHTGDWLNTNWFQLTSYGKSQLGLIGEDYYPIFLDPELTIAELRSSISNIDPITLRYFEEALKAIKEHLFLSATITMGGASESSILSLIDAVIDYYNDTTLIAAFDKINAIKPKFELLMTTMKDRNLKKDLLNTFKTDRAKCEKIREIFDNAETALRRMFDIYRINRNDAGHPTDMGSDPVITRTEAAMFRKFCKIVYGLILYTNEANSIRKGSSTP